MQGSANCAHNTGLRPPSPDPIHPVPFAGPPVSRKALASVISNSPLIGFCCCHLALAILARSDVSGKDADNMVRLLEDQAEKRKKAATKGAKITVVVDCQAMRTAERARGCEEAFRRAARVGSRALRSRGCFF